MKQVACAWAGQRFRGGRAGCGFETDRFHDCGESLFLAWRVVATAHLPHICFVLFAGLLCVCVVVCRDFEVLGMCLFFAK